MFTPILLDAHNPGPMTGRGNNTYFLHRGPGGAALIDAGVGDSRHLGEIDRELAVRETHLASVFVTHGHSDHADGSPLIARRHPTAAFAKFPWPEEDARYPVGWQPLVDGETVDAGGETLTVLHTPGHSPDHIAFWHAPTRAAFVGDLVIQGGSVMIPWSRGGNLEDYLASLERLIALRPRTLFPAHGPVIADPLACCPAMSSTGGCGSVRSSARSATAIRPCPRSPNPSMMVSIRRSCRRPARTSARISKS